MIRCYVLSNLNNGIEKDTTRAKGMIHLSRLTVIPFCLLLIVSFFSASNSSQTINAQNNGENKLVYVIPIEDRSGKEGWKHFLSELQKEVKSWSKSYHFEIDTPGGQGGWGKIGKLLLELDIPSTAFILNEALSAGSYIALNMDGNLYETQ